MPKLYVRKFLEHQRQKSPEQRNPYQLQRLNEVSNCWFSYKNVNCSTQPHITYHVSKLVHYSFPSIKLLGFPGMDLFVVGYLHMYGLNFAMYDVFHMATCMGAAGWFQFKTYWQTMMMTTWVCMHNTVVCVHILMSLTTERKQRLPNTLQFYNQQRNNPPKKETCPHMLEIMEYLHLHGYINQTVMYTFKGKW